MTAPELPAWRDVNEPEWRAVLASSTALASAQTEQDLVAQICSAAIDAGGYRLAWYGRLLHDGTYGFQRLAAAGPAAGYLDMFAPTWDDTPTGRGPGGTAVRTRAPVVIGDIAADPKLAPAAAAAADYGIRSMVCLPVIVAGQVDGILAIYSSVPDAFDATSVSIFTSLCTKIGLGIDRLRANIRIRSALEGTIFALSHAMDARDPYTAGHQQGVADLAGQIAITLGLDPHEVDGIRLAAVVHDIGKIIIPTSLLAKPTRLTDEEMALIRTHAVVGADIFTGIEFPWPIADMVRQHHERLDGTGYPLGLRGTEILPGSRIIAVADVVEAVGRARPYRPSGGMDTLLPVLAAGRVSELDPDAVDAALLMLNDGRFRL
jgi:putative nucleotidyltransferase with HDIG domain